jgi:hypothetical protein
MTTEERCRAALNFGTAVLARSVEQGFDALQTAISDLEAANHS